MTKKKFDREFFVQKGREGMRKRLAKPGELEAMRQRMREVQKQRWPKPLTLVAPADIVVSVTNQLNDFITEK